MFTAIFGVSTVEEPLLYFMGGPFCESVLVGSLSLHFNIPKTHIIGALNGSY